MTDTTLPSAGLSRRGLLKVGLLGPAFLATAGVTASLSGCSASVPANGLATLRSSDMGFLRALIPVVLAGAVKAEAMPAAVEKTIAGIDYSLTRFSPEMLKLTVQLLDVLRFSRLLPHTMRSARSAREEEPERARCAVRAVMVGTSTMPLAVLWSVQWPSPCNALRFKVCIAGSMPTFHLLKKSHDNYADAS